MLVVKNLKKTYKTKGGVEVHALDDVSVSFPENGMVFLLGKSGSGKSTLLNMIGGLDRVDSGEIEVRGKNSKTFSGADYDSYRNTYIGFIFQEYNILNEFNVEQNISLALQLQGKPNDKTAVDDILAQVDLKGLGKRKPNTLSGGQKQRVAIARALIKNPEIIMADEPTGALDSNTGKQVFETLKKLSKDKLVIVVSHDRDFAEYYGDRIIELSDGKIISDTSKEYVKPAEINDNVHMINQNTLAVKDTSKLSKKDMEIIFETLKSHEGEAVISSSEKDLVLFRQALHLNDDNSSEVFKDTTKVDLKEYNPDETKFIRSKLPFSRAFKMGASSLKIKPVRLIFTSLLTATSLAMFGLASTFMFFKESYSVSQALHSSVYTSEAICRYYNYQYSYYDLDLTTGEKDNEYTYDSSAITLMGEQEIAELNNNKVGHKYAGLITFNYSNKSYTQSYIRLKDSSRTNEYYNYDGITAFCDAGESYLNETGMSLIAGSYPTNSDEIAISTYQYELLKQTTIGANSYGDIINKEYNIEVGGNMASYPLTVKIKGIYKSEDMPSKFDDLKDPLQLEPFERNKLEQSYRNYLVNSFQTIVFVSPSFYNAIHTQVFDNFERKEQFCSMSTTGLGLSYEPIDYSIPYESYEQVTTSKVFDYIDAPTVYDKNGHRIPYVAPNKNQIYVSLDFYDMYKFQKEIDNGAPLENDPELTTYYYKTYNNQSGSLEVIGFLNYGNGYLMNHDLVTELGALAESSVYIGSSSTDYTFASNPKYTYAITPTEFNQRQVEDLLAKKGTYYYEMTNDIYYSLQVMLSLIAILQNVFLVSGIVFGVFAALMLFNFISTSIAAKTKEIGILRAVGARGNDLFKIFFSESGLIAIICSIVAIIATAIGCWRFNDTMYQEVGLRMLDFNFLNIAIILGGAVIIAVIGTIIPVILAAKKPPVESIRTL